MTTNEPTQQITGATLIEWGHKPGKHFPELIAQANALGQGNGWVLYDLKARLEEFKPVQQDLRAPGAVPFHENIDAGDIDAADNIAKVRETMTELMRTPTIRAGAIMPDACPAGPVGTIPVGAVVAAENAIHPGMHSADICCSVMMSDLGEIDPKAVLDAAQSVTHFGPGGRANGRRFTVSYKLLEQFAHNPFLSGTKVLQQAQEHMGTQGDGNHFLFVGRSRKTGRTAMITHHGSRGPGASLYKAGMAVAERYRRELSPQTRKQNAWIPMDTEDGLDYWDALQLIRKWTKANHSAIHQATADAAGAHVQTRFWNEHNFVFERDGLYFHGKGATPAWSDYAPDATGLTLIPLNMAEPVLVVRGTDAPHALGFSPHGAGRNYSRSEHRRRLGAVTPAEQVAAETAGLDIRFPAGAPDVSELPSSYKRADHVVQQIKDFGLAEIEDYIDPYGCLMAGDIPPFWRDRKKGRQ